MSPTRNRSLVDAPLVNDVLVLKVMLHSPRVDVNGGALVKRYEALAIADYIHVEYRSPRNATRSGNGNKPLGLKIAVNNYSKRE